MRTLISRVNNPPIFLILAMLVLLLPAILTGHVGEGGLASDAIKYHLPQIEAFRTAPFNFLNYEATATTLPLYHAMIGWLGILTGEDVIDNNDVIVRIAHVALSLIGPFILFQQVFRKFAVHVALLMCLPVASSFYVLSGALYYGTDGPGFSLFLLSLLAFSSPIARPSILALSAMAVAATRHLYFPGTLGAAFGRLVGPDSPRVKLGVLIGLVPSMFVLGIYFVYWGATRPANDLISDLNPQGVFVYSILAHFGIVAVWGTAFGLLIWEDLLTTWRDRRTWIFAASTTLILSSFWGLSETYASVPNGRFGSIIWRVSDLVLIGDRSVVVLLLAIGGGLILSMYTTKLLRENIPLVAMGALLATVVSLGLTYAAYQRYSEPAVICCFLLMNLAFNQRPPVALYRFIPIILLSLMGFMTFMIKVYL